MEQSVVVIWREKRSAADAENLPTYLNQADFSGVVVHAQERYENVLSFLEGKEADESSLILLEDALTKYTSESNYRRVLALLFERGAKESVAVVSELLTAANLPMIFRALRTLGVNQYVTVSNVENRCLLTLKRGVAQLNTSAWRMDWSPFMNRQDTQCAVKSVIKAIEEQKPFSMLRVGHCEVRFLAYGYLYGESDIDASAALQWGQSVDSGKAQWIQNNLVKAIANASMLGYKARAEFSSKPLKIFENSVSMCLENLSLLRPGQIQVDPNVHFALGKSVEFLRALAGAKTVVIISPRTELAEQMSSLFGETVRIELITLPGEFRIDGPTDIAERFARFVEIETEVARLTGKGVVFLVGAGVAGKQYCEIARAGGGIGLDLGSTLDAWAGIDSRGHGFPLELKQVFATYRDSNI
jgi:hypothetical protein